QESDESSKRAAEAGRRTGDPGDRAKLEGHVRTDQRAGREWQVGGGGRNDGSYRGHTGSAHFWKPKHSRMVLGNTDGFRGHAALRGAERGASDDRKIPARESGGGLRANDERPCAVPRGFWVTRRRAVSSWHSHSWLCCGVRRLDAAFLTILRDLSS